MTLPCPFCVSQRPDTDAILLEKRHVYFLRSRDPVLQCAGMIIPFRHVETPFGLSPEEWSDTFELLAEVKLLLDRQQPDGYTIGWNVGHVGGQTVPHVHLHVIGRFSDEPYAGQGMRHHLKQEANIRKRPKIDDCLSSMQET